MFSLFRKEGSVQPLSPHELLSSNEASVGDSPATNAGIVGVDRASPGHVERIPEPTTAQAAPANDGLGLEAPTHIDASAGKEGLASPEEVGVTPRPLDDDAASADELLRSREEDWFEELAAHRPANANLRARPRGKRLERPVPSAEKRKSLTPQQRLLLLDSWRRSGLPAGDFASLVGISKHTLYKWDKQFQELGPEGLMDQPRGARSGGRLSELTKRTILMLKESHPEWGCERISDMLRRGPALAASPSTVARVLHEAGYEMVQEPTRAHPDKVRRFERAKPNQLWQTDLFTFMLKRQNRRVHLVAFMDDHSRFIISYGLHTRQSHYP